MKLREGKIGLQESASLTGLACAMSVIFTCDAKTIYDGGNATYISLPLSIALALGVFLLMQAAMKKTGAKELTELMKRCVGAIPANILALGAAGLLVFAAWSLLERFTAVLHSSIYMTSEYAPVVIWVAAAVAFIALLGFECTARMAKCFALPLGLLLIIGLAGASSSFETYRLSPFPAKPAEHITKASLEGLTSAFPAFLAMLCAQNALQGRRSAVKTVSIGAGAAFIATLAVQLCLGMIYTYSELSGMLMPMYRLNMKLIQEGYWFRLDKLSLFIWLIGCMISCALYIYAASNVVTRMWTKFDVRPGIASMCAVTVALLILQHVNDSAAVSGAVSAVKNYVWLVMLLFPAAAIIGILRKAKGGQSCESA